MTIKKSSIGGLLVQKKEFHLINSFYFGWVKYGGHGFLQRGESYCSPLYQDRVPWKAKELDCKLQPHDEFQTEGITRIHYKNGWTAISFWDRSGDSRWNSNTSFIAEGIFSFNEMIEIAKDGFPNICKRFTFEIREKEDL